MKRFALAGLSILCLSLVATTSVKAETRTGYLSMSPTTTLDNPIAPTITPSVPTTSTQSATRTGHISMLATNASNNAATPSITPFELISRAYQGSYQMQGIPGFASFQSAISSQTITAKDLVKVAISAKELAPATQTDRNYLNAVELQLLSQQH